MDTTMTSVFTGAANGITPIIYGVAVLGIGVGIISLGIKYGWRMFKGFGRG